MLKLLATLGLLVAITSPLKGQEPSPPERPNILWITSEDNAAHWIGCYGNSQAQTPHIDRLATEGIRFTRAYSNGAVCAVARSTLITGVHAITQGTQHMRSRYPLAEPFRPYVTYLREAGYYCINNAKTDYNFAGDDRSWWDKSSKQAHYKNRPEGAPFFAIINTTISHESSLFDSGPTPSEEATRLNPAEVFVPPYLPDLPAVRRDIARYHDVITRMDRQVGAILEDLDRRGLADSTIVFYFSDHGGILPRSKRYLYDTGTHVPLVVRIPPMYRHLWPQPHTGVREDVVEFVDLPPTLLHLAGVEIPEHMPGRPLTRVDDQADEPRFALLFADRFDETYRHQRAITDGTWRYLHNFMPHLPSALRNGYPYGIPSWQSWRDHATSDHATTDHVEPRHQQFWRHPQGASELYHTANDPWEVTNLATSTHHVEQLHAMRARLRQELLDRRDLGLIPEPFWPELAPESSIYSYAHRGDFPWQQVVDAAFRASMATAADLPQFTEWMAGDHPVLRYWGALGCLVLAEQGRPAKEQLQQLIKDPHVANRITALHALHLIDPQPQWVEQLAREATTTSSDPAATLALDTLSQLQATDKLTTEELEQLAGSQQLNYATRWAKRILTQRTLAQ